MQCRLLLSTVRDVMSVTRLLQAVRFVGHVMSPHHTGQISQRSQVSRIALCRCSLNVFVFIIVLNPSNEWKIQLIEDITLPVPPTWSCEENLERHK